MLHTWLTEHHTVANAWPGSTVTRAIETAIEDGCIDTEERSALLSLLTGLSANQFADTGSASAEVIALPVDNDCDVSLMNARVCLTGEFAHGTRTQCEQRTLQAGAELRSTVNGKTDYLVLGANASPSWAHTSFGRKIQQAIEAQREGCKVKIISEARWESALA
jgi:NAD-dependent DNA ligase